jgi:hypothetical protein
MNARKDYGPVQLAGYLGLLQFQFDRARADGLIPPPDRARGRWSASIADDALARVAEIRAAAGTVPDFGAVRAAEELSKRLGIAVTGHGVEELARRGLLPVAGYYKDHAIYDGRAVEAFTDTAAATEARRAGYLRTADESAAYLAIRRSDLDHLSRSGLLAPAGWGYGPYDRRRNPAVPLYRTGDLDGLAARDDLPWDAVRQARKGQRSPLAELPAARPCLHDGGTLAPGGAQ